MGNSSNLSFSCKYQWLQSMSTINLLKKRDRTTWPISPFSLLYAMLIFYFLSMLQSLWGYQAEGLYFLGHWYVCCWPSGKYHEESAQSAPCVYTCPGRWGFQSLFLLAEKKMLYFPQMWQGQLVTITFPCLLLYRACMGWRTKSSWASLVSWATVAWQMSFTWRWSLRRRSSWWRVLRPCGVYRRSSLCEKHVSEFSSCP